MAVKRKELWERTPLEVAAGLDAPPQVHNEMMASHKRIVRQAIADGKPVPPEVLKAYPDLSPGPLDKPPESGIMTSGETEGQDGNGKSTKVPAQRGHTEGQDTDVPERMSPEGISTGESQRQSSGMDRPEGGELPKRGRKPDEVGGVGDRGVEPRYPVGDTGERERLTTTPRDIILTSDSDVEADVGPAARFDANLTAIRTVKALEADGRQATPEEQATIAKFSGFGDGAFNDAFDRYEREGAWKRRGDELREILTSEEYQSIERSRINAFFTTPEVIKATWDGLREMGIDTLKHPRVLEPSAGSGRYLGYQPQDLAARSSRIAVELDDLSGQMLKQTYPEAETYIMGYQNAPIPKDSIDVAISNVPFGNIPVTDPDFRKGRRMLSRSIHNYFFAKALDHLRPGGVLAFVTSHYTLDSPKAKPVREALAERADLVSAVRLPKGAFPDTEVVADLIFMRKREPEEAPGDTSWVNSVQMELEGRYGSRPYNVNQYYIDHPEMVMGTHSATGSMRGGDEYTVEPGDIPLGPRLSNAVARMPRGIITESAIRETRPRSVSLPSAMNIREGAHVVGDDGVITVKRYGNMEHVELSTDDHTRVTRMLAVRDAARKVLRTQLDDMPAADLHAAQAILNESYDAFVESHGALNAKPNAELLKSDPDGPFLRSLEEWDVKGAAKPFQSGKPLSAKDANAIKMPVFTKPVITGTGRKSANDETDAMAQSLNEAGRLDFNLMAESLGRDAQDIKDKLANSRQIFKNPVGDWESADKYLSGEVREKLRIAEAAATASPAYTTNVEALRAVQPLDLPPSQISARLGTTWIPGTDVDDFIIETLSAYRPWRQREEGYFRYVTETGEWVKGKGRIEGDSGKMTSEYGTNRMPADVIIGRLLNGKAIDVNDKIEDKTVRNVQETVAAQEKAAALQEAFRQWIWKDPDRAARLAAHYNETFNASRPRQFDGSHLALPGIAEKWQKKIHSHQKDAIWRVVQDRTALLAHEVGFGKTAVMVGAGMELKRLGMANKVMYVVPKATHAQFAEQFLDIYPHSNVLMPTDDDFSPGKRPEFISRAVTGDWDAVILSDTQFRRIPIKPETEAAFLRQEVDNYRAALEAEAQESGGRYGRGSETKTHKELQKALVRMEEKLREAQAKVGGTTEQTTYFEDMGVDQLFVDESDNFKNLQFATSMGRLKGLPNSRSDRAWDMYQKTRYLQQHGKDHGVAFATGTPVANTIAEMYTMMRYLQEPMLEAKGIQHFDAWAKTFGETTESLEQTPTGAYRMTQRFSKFMNAPELSQIWQQVADIRVADEVPDVVKRRPHLIDEQGKPRRTVIAVPPDEQLLEYMQFLSHRADTLSGKDPREDNMLKIASDARMASLDMRMVDAQATANPDGKVPVASAKIAEIYRDTMKDKGTQLVFLDLGTPKATDKVDEEAGALDSDEETTEEVKVLRNVYKVIKENLIAKGVPTGEIAFIHDAKTNDQRTALQKKVNDGVIRVIIGSTGKMGVGLNVQKRAAALHHLDAPWRPRDIEQREGRIIRQGNEVYGPELDNGGVLNPGPGVKVYTYVTERSFDAYMWQAIEAKSKAIKAIMRRNNPPRVIEDIDSFTMSAGEAKAVASGNPDVLRAVTLKNEVNRLQMLEASHTDATVRANTQLATLPDRIAESKGSIGKLEKDAALVKAAPEKFTMQIQGRTFSERPVASEALTALVKNNAADTPAQAAELAKYKGFSIKAIDQGPSTGYKILVTNPATDYTHATSSILYSDLTPAGLMQRIDNRIQGIGTTLEKEQRQMVSHESNLKTYQEQAAKPFEYQPRLEASVKLLQALNDKLQGRDVPAEDLQPATSVDEMLAPDEDAADIPGYRFSAREEEQAIEPVPAVVKVYRPLPSKEETMARIWAGETTPVVKATEPPKPTMPKPDEKTYADVIAKAWGTTATAPEPVSPKVKAELAPTEAVVEKPERKMTRMEREKAGIYYAFEKKPEPDLKPYQDMKYHDAKNAIATNPALTFGQKKDALKALAIDRSPKAEKTPSATPEEYGRIAFEQGIIKAPAQDKAFLDDYIAGKEVGDESGLQAMKEWNKGFHKANLAAPLPTIDIAASEKPVIVPRERKQRAKRIERHRRADLVDIQENRSEAAQTADVTQKHSIVVTPDSPEVEKWIEDPGSMDVQGIDTPPVKKPRKPRKPKAEAPVKKERKPRAARKAKPKAVKPKGKRLMRSELMEIQEGRSARSIGTDVARKHSTVVPVTSQKTRQWAKDQGSMDIQGIDTPGSKTPRITDPKAGISHKGTPRITGRGGVRITKRMPRLK